MAKATKGSGQVQASRVPADLLAAAGDLIATAQATSAPLTKRAVRDLGKLGKQLDKARATESKRLRQLAKAEATKGTKRIAKRRRQAGEAAADVAALVGRIGDRARVALGDAAGAAGNAMRDVGSATAVALEAVSPVKAPRATPSGTVRRRRGPATKRTVPAKPAATGPVAPKAAATKRGPAKVAATRKPATRKPATTESGAPMPTVAAPAPTLKRTTRKPSATRTAPTTRKPATTGTRRRGATAATRKPASPSTRRSPRPAAGSGGSAGA